MSALFSGEHNLSMAAQTRVSSLFTDTLSERRTRPFLCGEKYYLPAKLGAIAATDFVEAVAFSKEVKEKKRTFMTLKDKYERGTDYSVEKIKSAQKELFDIIQKKAADEKLKSVVPLEVGAGVTGLWDCAQLAFADPSGIIAATASVLTVTSVITSAAKYIYGFYAYKPRIKPEAFDKNQNNIAGTVWLDTKTASAHYEQTLKREAAAEERPK
jgi:hypothetical protein